MAALVLAGDDHVAKSSTIPHQSDFSLFNVGIPFFYPGNTQEVLDFGLLAIALSRFSAAWVGLKLVTNVCDGGGTVELDPDRPAVRLPEGFERYTDPRLVPPFTLALEREVNRRRLEAAREFARINHINRWFGARRRAARSAGKSYYDLMQALQDLDIAGEDLEKIGVRIAQIGMTYPLDRHFAAQFAQGLETLLVVEEKRSFLELQLRESLYNLSLRPTIIGKEDEEGKELFRSSNELDPDTIARILASRLSGRVQSRLPGRRVEMLDEVALRPTSAVASRHPNYCSGCPHNRSTLLLEGQVAGGGIGCHGMGIMLDDPRRTFAFATHMGGEGAPWIGMAPFAATEHIFQNMGDGTFAHSGQLAINACVAAGVNITFKILYNGAVAMTGGQHAEGLPIRISPENLMRRCPKNRGRCREP